jgi:peptide/nickel transport system substrate-binding protein
MSLLLLGLLVSAIPARATSSPVPRPSNPLKLVDDTQGAYPDSLDPAWGFSTQDASVFNNVFQELVEYNGANDSQVVPVLASSYSVSPSNLNYTFQIRPGVYFTNGDPVTAAAAWFSLVRVLYMNAPTGIGPDDYFNITISPAEMASLGMSVPWGFRHAVAYATGDPAVLTDLNTFESKANNLLSNFNPSNPVIQALVSYPHQAYVVTGPMTLQANLIQPYAYFTLDIAGWWGAIVDPAFVDATGGVQAFGSDQAFNSNGGPGTGPYEIQSVSPGSQITLEANPHYWDTNNKVRASNVEKATITTVVINYGLGLKQVEQSFDNGTAQLAAVPVPNFGETYNNYAYKESYTFSQVLRDLGSEVAWVTFAFNTQTFPTDNNDYRLALVHTINYTAILHDLYYSYQGIPYASEQFGPVPPSVPLSKSLDTANYGYDIRLAARYMNQAMNQLGYHVTMLNGTVLGNPLSPQFPVQTFYYSGTLSPEELAEFNLISAGFAQLGIKTVYAQNTFCNCSPQTTPPYLPTGWLADFTDPYYQLIQPAFSSSYGGINGWIDVSSVNATLAHIINELPFYTSSSQQLAYTRQIYMYMKGYAPAAWMPVPDFTFFVQPYVKGLFINPIMFAFNYDSISYGGAPPA